MVEALINLAGNLEGNSLILYIMCLGLLGGAFYLLKINRSLGDEIHKTNEQLAAISEQLRTLVSAALTGKKRNGD